MSGITRYLFAFYLGVLTATSGWAQFSPPADDQGQQKPSVAAPLEDFVRRIGPLKIREQSFTVELHEKRVRVAWAVGSEETVERMEFRDEAGTVHHEQTFPYEVEADHFAETRAIDARVLEGNQGSGILVTMEVEPSTPLGGASYQVLGLFNGRLVPFSPPLSMEGNLIQPEPPPEKVIKTSTEQGLQGDLLRFRVWTGNVFVIIPVRVDWPQAKMNPACQVQGANPSRDRSQGPQNTPRVLGLREGAGGSRNASPICRFNVEAEPRPPESESSSVRLYPEFGKETGGAEPVVIKKTSKIEVLEAAGETIWQEGKEQVNLKAAEDLWLNVRIDAKEGWIHTQEDFTAVGLPRVE